MPRLSTSDKLNRVQARLRRGDITNIAESTGYDLSHVYRVLRGESSPNVRIINEAYTKVGSRKVTA